MQDSSEFRQFLDFVEARRNRDSVGRDRIPRRRERDSHESGDDAERSNAGPPPVFDGTQFKDFQIRAKLWLATTKSKPRTRGPLLLKNMTGTAFDNFKYLAKDDSWLSDPSNGEKLIQLMDTREYYGDDSREDMLNCLGKLTYQIKRTKGEDQRTFCARWENAVRKVREHGVQLPKEYLGFLFIMALQLSPEEVKLLMNFSKGSLDVTDVKEWLRVHETELDFKIGTKEATKSTEKKGLYLLGEPDDDPSEPCPDEDSDYEILLAAAEELGVEGTSEESEVFEESEAKEILATMVKEHGKFSSGKGGGKGGGKRNFANVTRMKKTKELSREYGRGRNGVLGTGTYRVSIEELKSRTRCGVCKQIGHWHRDKECPGRNPKNASSSNHAKDIQFLESDEVLFLEYQDYKNEIHHLSFPDDFEPLTNAVNQWKQNRSAVTSTAGSSDGASSEIFRAYKVRAAPTSETWLTSHGFEQLRRDDLDERSCATVDTGCQRSAIGLETLRQLHEAQPKDLDILMMPETHRFCSVHGTSTTSRVACIPNSIGPNGCILRPAVFEDSHGSRAPFLLSLPFLLECRATLELDPVKGLSMYLKKYRHRISLHLGPTGALRVPLHEFTPQMLEHLKTGTQKLQSSREHEILLNDLARADREAEANPHEHMLYDKNSPRQNNDANCSEAFSGHGGSTNPQSNCRVAPSDAPFDDLHRADHSWNIGSSLGDAGPCRTPCPSSGPRNRDDVRSGSGDCSTNGDESGEPKTSGRPRRLHNRLGSQVCQTSDSRIGSDTKCFSIDKQEHQVESRSSPMRLSQKVSTVRCTETGEQLLTSVLEVPKLESDRPHMQLFPMESATTRLERSIEEEREEPGFQSGTSEPMPASSHHQDGQQWMDDTNQVSGLPSGARKADQDANSKNENIPADSMDPQLWKEYQEFQKFKQMSR